MDERHISNFSYQVTTVIFPFFPQVPQKKYLRYDERQQRQQQQQWLPPREQCQW